MKHCARFTPRLKWSWISPSNSAIPSALHTREKSPVYTGDFFYAVRKLATLRLPR